MKKINNNAPTSKEFIARMLEILRGSFASRPDAFFVTMVDVLLEDGYTVNQIQGGIKDLVRTCGYNQLSISSIVAACLKQPPRRSEWKVFTEKKVGTYDQFKIDQFRYGDDSVKFIKDIDE